MIQRPLRLFSAVVLTMVLLALQGCSLLRDELKEPDIKLLGFERLPGKGLLEQRFSLRLRLSNPNDLRLQVKGLSFTLEVEGVELVRGQSHDVPEIAPYSDTDFTVTGSAYMLDALRLFDRLRRDADTNFHYTLYTDIDLARGWPASYHLKREGDMNLLEKLGKKGG